MVAVAAAASSSSCFVTTDVARDDPVVSWATRGALRRERVLHLGLMCGPADPFIHNGAKVLQGAGPNALLQDNPLVAIHPPLLYMGFVGFTVPFAFAIAMLITGRVHDRWPLEQRRWTVLAWGVLSVGIVLGAWWSYQVLGWGGFWGWDPVENAALLPWLTATAYIHSVIVQDRRGLFRVWNLSLAIATFALTVLGHVLHAFGRPAERARVLVEHARSAVDRLLLRHGRARCGTARVAR